MKCALVSYWDDVDAIVPTLQTYDKIFACEQAAYDLLMRGVTLACVIGDFDSVPLAAFEPFAVKTIQLPQEKNETDTHALLQYIIDAYPHAQVTLYNAFSDRLDHALVLLSLFAIKNDLMIQAPDAMFYYLEPGSHEVAQHVGYHYISFVALTEVLQLTISGLKYALAPTDIQPFCDRTISNEFTKSGVGTVAFSAGALLVVYARDKQLNVLQLK